MKIFMLADTMDIGGAETHIWELSRLLIARGHQVTVLSGGGRLASDLPRIGVRHVTIPPLTDPHVMPAAMRMVADEIRRQKPHIVHAHTRRSAFLCRLLSHSMSFPIVVTAHAMFRSQFPLGKLSFFPPSTIAVSQDIRQLLIRRFSLSPDHVTLIENGIDTRRFRPRPSETHPFTVMTVSRLDRDCALTARLLMIAAPLLMQALGRPVRIVILGGGDAYEGLFHMAQSVNEKLGRPVISMLGNRTDVDRLLGQCDVFVGVSRAALEAMSSGKPVILCGNEGYLGILDQENLATARETNFCARGCPKASVTRLIRDIQYLASLPHSERVIMGTAGRLLVRRFYSAEVMAQKTEDVYRTELARFQRTRRTDAVICGYYGYGNCGDELVLRHILGCQRTLAPHLRLSVLSSRKDAKERFVYRYGPMSVAREIKNSGAFILGGGSLLQDTTSRRSLAYYLMLLSIAHKMGIPTMLYANGLGPLSPKALEQSRKVLASVDVISLRDRRSYEAVRAMHLPHTRVVLGADPVLSHEPRKYDKDQPPFLAVFPKGNRPQAELSALTKAVAALAEHRNLSIVIVPMDQRQDTPAAHKMATRIRKSTHVPVKVETVNHQTVEGVIGRANLVISQRLHALILAFATDVPLVGIGCDPKIHAFLSEIRESAHCLEPSAISNATVSRAAAHALSHSHDPHIAATLRLRALRDATLAHRLILRDDSRRNQ